MSYLERAKCKINDFSFVVGIIGLGYVGLPLAIRFAASGLKVIGFDIDTVKIDSLTRNVSYFSHISDQAIGDLNLHGFEPTNNFSRVAECDGLIICVPTPLGKHREPDLSFIISTLESLLPYLKPGQIMALESTTWPGTTEEVVRPKIEEKGFVIGESFFLIFSPEREDPGNQAFNTKTIPKLIGGESVHCSELGQLLYQAAVDNVVLTPGTKVAEMAKLLENIYRSINIGLANEMKIICDAIGIDVYDVIEAAATKPFGFNPFYPGPGLGGHCIPIDPFYLTWKAREYGISSRFIELAGEINTYMPKWVIDRVAKALNTRSKPLRGSRILVLGVAYKKNIDDQRESPAIEIINSLIELGSLVSYSDPFIPSIKPMRKYDLRLDSVVLNPGELGYYDCVLLVTDHDKFNYEMIFNNSSLLVDTRGRFHGLNSPHLFSA